MFIALRQTAMVFVCCIVGSIIMILVISVMGIINLLGKLIKPKP